MKSIPTPPRATQGHTTWFGIPRTSPALRRLTMGLAALAFTAAFSAQAAVQIAGSLFINVDATPGSVGLANGITNSGSLGGVFDSTNQVPLATISNVNA